MGKTWILMVTCAVMLSGMEAFACTGLLVGKKASVDGSVMISYAADSHTLYGELYRWPAATWPKGAMLDIIEWDTHKPLGQIPQVEQTYSVVGNMNEHQVAITESTFGGRPELVDTTGIMDYGSLIYVTLQRSKTAREAIRIMTDLVKDYGYYSSGETFSIADKNEAWVMEMIGKGPGNKFRLMPINLVFSRSRLMIRRTAFIHRMLSLLLVKRDISVAGIRILVSRKPIARMISVLCVVVKPVCGLSFANMINRWINIWI